MLTNNWKNLIKGLAQGVLVSDRTDIQIYQYGYVDGSTKCYYTGAVGMASDFLACIFLSTDRKNVRTNSNSTGVIFGNGTALPTVNDTALSGAIITNIVATSISNNIINDDGTCTGSVTYTITNSDSNDIVISEIGYVGTCKLAYQDSQDRWYSKNEHILLDHTLLEEPVTIPPGGIGQVTYNITLGMADILEA